MPPLFQGRRAGSKKMSHKLGDIETGVMGDDGAPKKRIPNRRPL
jgi:hypothetical protein